MTTAALPIPADLAADFALRRAGSEARLRCYLLLATAGPGASVASIARDAGVGRSTAYELHALLRELLADAARTTGGRSADAGRTVGAGTTPTPAEAGGQSADAARTTRGRRADTAPAGGRSADARRTLDRPARRDTPAPGGRSADDLWTTRGDPTDRLSDPPTSKDRLAVGEEIDHRQPVLSTPASATAEGRLLLEILVRWSTVPKPPRRLRVDLDADLAWFTRAVLADPQNAEIDVLAALTKWDIYLEAQYRKAQAGQRSSFPTIWKTSLLRALGFAREDEARAAARAAWEPPPVPTRPDPPQRQPFEVPIRVPGEGAMDGWEETDP